MARQNLRSSGRRAGFSLVELLIVIAVIAILSGLLLPYVLGTRESSQVVIARQQQGALQTALGNWVASVAAQPGGIAAARNSYNSAGNKLDLLQNYLQPSTLAALDGNGSQISSAALAGAGASLQFSSWPVGGTPSVNWINSP